MSNDQFEGMNYCTKCGVWFQPSTLCNCFAPQRGYAPYYPPYYPWGVYPVQPYYPYPIWWVTNPGDGVTSGITITYKPSGTTTTFVGGNYSPTNSVDIDSLQGVSFSYTAIPATSTNVGLTSGPTGFDRVVST